IWLPQIVKEQQISNLTRRIYYGRLLRRRVYRYGCVGCIRRPDRKQKTAGGFFGPSIMGWLKDLTGSFNAGLVAMAGFLLLATALTGALKSFVREE
ncbi:MAG: hypothetical protein DMG18_03005, partial [Acidobacteria bacterium]